MVKTAARARGRKRPKQTFIQRSRALGAEEKALYHQVAGAGKSHVRRRFFEMSESDMDLICQRVEQGIEQGLKQSA
jgi:hypothetical protein